MTTLSSPLQASGPVTRAPKAAVLTAVAARDEFSAGTGRMDGVIQQEEREPWGGVRRLTGMRAARTLAVLGAIALVLAGCGQGASEVSEGGAEANSDGAPETLECGGNTYLADAVQDAPPSSSLGAGPAGAVSTTGEPAFDPTMDWSVVHEDDDRAVLLRELEEPTDSLNGDVRTHDVISLERITGADNVSDGSWMLTSAGACSQRIVYDDGLPAADVTLAQTPMPNDRTIALNVFERTCASGQAADGRVQVYLEETGEQVRLRVAVRQLPEGGDCQGNPATPVTVELTDPLGDRVVVDVSVVPERVLTAGG